MDHPSHNGIQLPKCLILKFICSDANQKNRHMKISLTRIIRVKAIKKSVFTVTALILFLVAFNSCTDSALLPPPDPENFQTTSLASYSMADLEKVASDLEKQGYDVANTMEQIREKNPENPNARSSAFVIKSKKVVIKIPNPSNIRVMMDVSAVLLYPRFHSLLHNMQLIVATPGTYTVNSLAPSNLFGDLWTLKRSDLEEGIAIAPYLLNAALQPVLIIDYPGFGSSFGQLQHPYLDQMVIAVSSIRLIKAAQKTLKEDLVKLVNNDLIITGYSQGAFSATAIAREIETSPENKDLSIRLISVGGTPANLSQVLDYSIKHDFAEVPFFFPYALWGYKKARYPNIPAEKIIKEPYYTMSLNDFQGYGAINYPQKVSTMYTEDFLKNYKTSSTYSEVRRALDENNIKPWVNKAPLYMLHGTSDITVEFEQAKDFALEMNAAGGNVKFAAYPGLNHYSGAIAYVAAFNLQLALAK